MTAQAIHLIEICLKSVNINVSLLEEYSSFEDVSCFLFVRMSLWQRKQTKSRVNDVKGKQR